MDSEAIQVSQTEISGKVVNFLQPLTGFAESSIADVSPDSKHITALQ